MTHGRLELSKDGKLYRLHTKPHVRMKLKRLLPGVAVRGETLTMHRSPETTEDLLWILSRWHHDTPPGLREAMGWQTAANQENRSLAAAIVAGTAPVRPPVQWNPEFPMRKYQAQAVALGMIQPGLLIGDDIGLGKTATGLGIIAQRGGKGLVVCQKHLVRQWENQVKQFLPGMTTHVIKQRKGYEMPPHDITVCPYSMLAHWGDQFVWDTVVYDEVQELRAATTEKYKGAQHLCAVSPCRVGLSATPTYNNAGEIYNIMEILAPGICGSPGEFKAEWGSDAANKFLVNDPEALGEWLRGQGVYIRRTKRDVGMELPPVLKVSHMLEHDHKVIDRLRLQANELAERVLTAGFHEKGKNARQLDILLRQMTGIAKAIQVADFVRALVNSGEKVVLTGWHREVYEIWKRHFTQHKVPFAMFTGSETSVAKIKAKADFISGAAQVLILSNRSGAGLDGLQYTCKTIVIGELDWSPKVIEQAIGRLDRPGQPDVVTAFYLYIDRGADPIMAAVLARKWEQSTSLTDPDLVNDEPTPVPESRVSELARDWLNQQKTKE